LIIGRFVRIRTDTGNSLSERSLSTWNISMSVSWFLAHTKNGSRITESTHRKEFNVNNVVSLKDWKEKRTEQIDLYRYEIELMGMDKLELLEEMVRFQELRGKQRDVCGEHIPPETIERGLILFKQLKKNAETPELETLCASYLKSLEAKKGSA
jgi:hypothetical protein